MTIGEKWGREAADLIIDAAHLTFNAPRGKQMVLSCIKRLQERIDEIYERKKTEPKYDRDRHGKG